MASGHKRPPTGRGNEGTATANESKVTLTMPTASPLPVRYAPSGKRRRYTDDERGMAVAMLQANGYPDVVGSLQRTANSTGIPVPTLLDWHTGNRWVDSEVREENKRTLSQMYREIAEKYAERTLAEDNIQRANGRDAITVSAIAVDKMRLLEGLPTQIVSIMPDVIGALNALGQDAQQALLRIIARAEEQADYKRLGSG